MTPAMERHLRSLTNGQRSMLAADSRRALRDAWRYRYTNPRARIVCTTNVRMLRNLGELS